MHLTQISARIKLLALEIKYYQRVKWKPRVGDSFTSSTANLQLFRIIKIDNLAGIYTIALPGGKHHEIPRKGFTTSEQGRFRVHVPRYLLSTFGTNKEDSEATTHTSRNITVKLHDEWESITGEKFTVLGFNRNNNPILEDDTGKIRCTTPARDPISFHTLLHRYEAMSTTPISQLYSTT